MATKQDLKNLSSVVDNLTINQLEHGERLDRIECNMAAKQDLQEISNNVDKLVGLAEKKDQEVTLQTHRIRELTDKVDRHDKDIERIKPIVGLSETV
ncbi:MAG: hypothetical protein GF349_04665 [Candidatus Magasanikbacteria bacterium]|nr:hypothetical protein [Candidatus Magasanikbacteria bacterium]